ncbi:RagB/SusD family nutrient uptake outer membrane protein [Pedobacter sp. BS3]|uniref:RagB/SusD family nutrient uptake outer membrane protein n=1 Tax=Pedobacter sp. BS3 TaxID=2567937 RepID=UPI0011ED838D|nr:RagB/SusD family nutrient uptake outer membrane protein [Pedobacter sp. BS3]TZF83277.1 RagB/SusD family nutrient uptake outer membrane protein [Pedobacter sp. BS3]
MKRIPYITCLLAIAALISCKKDFLDRTPGADLSDEKVFSDPTLAVQYADNAYNYLIDEYARFNAHRGTTSQASDEAVSGNTDVSVRTLNQGLFHDHYERGGAALNDIGDVWERAYGGIRVANVMLSKMETIPWTSAQSPARIEGEMHFIRAFLYFELIKRFGGVPIVDKPATIFDDVDIPRNTYQECVDFIISDLDKTESLLPEDYNASNYGRATLGAARALRSRVLLYAASPLNNPSEDKEKWRLAAAAARSVIDMHKYSLQATYNDIMNMSQSPEYIMIKVRAPRAIDGFLLDFVMSPGSGGAQGSMNPTQNHVDLYEMKATGLPITDPASGYDATKPYDGRDPRFYANILYNDADWQGRKMGMWSQTAADGTVTYGADFRPNNIIYSATRYYCRKMWPEVYVRNTTQRALFNFIFFRYAEILLNYAEAQNEYLDAPDASVYDAINEVRRRPSVNMPDIPANLTKEQMRDAIQHERAVELAFEDFRWYDLMRWKLSVDVINQPVKGMDVIKNSNGTFTYNVVTLPSIYQKKFDEHMYLYPIPRSEIFKSKDILKQNPGW